MTERFILKKSDRKGSLARRLLLGMTLLIVIPLFIHTIFLYLREYQGDINTVRIFLSLVRQDKVQFLEEIISEKQQMLENLTLDLDPHQIEIFHAEEIAPSFPEKKSPFFTRVNWEKHWLWVGRNVSPKTALGLSIDLDYWLSQWKYLEQYSFPLFIEICNEEGRILCGSSSPEEKNVIEQEKIDDSELFLRLSVPLKAVQHYEISYYAYSVFTLIVLIGALGGGAVILFARRISKPFKDLCQTMERVSEGKIHCRYRIDPMGFEINTLGERFNQTLDELLKRTQEVEKEKIHRERLAQQLKIGHEIQKSMLPASLPTFSGLDLAPGYAAALEVSGDLYDFFQIDSDRILCLVADCAGKGIPACLYSLGFRSALRAFAKIGKNLSEIVKRANELLILDTAESGFFITAWLGLYDAKTGILQYCSQGHPPALLKRGAELKELSTGGIPFGISSFIENSIEEIQLLQDDFLLLYTDGVLETHNLEKEFFGMRRLKEFLLSFEKNSAADCIDDLLTDLKRFSQETAQYDDITLLAMKFFR